MVSQETPFIIQTARELEKKYSGKYIAVFRGKVVASGKTIADVYKATDKLKIEKPLVTYVPKEGEEMLLV